MPDFYDLWPHKFTNVTNGVTPRRWVSPMIKNFLNEYVGEDWITNMDSLNTLEASQYDVEALEKIEQTKLLGKHDLSVYIQDNLGITVDPSSMFDVHVKRIHEYKRQHFVLLKLLYSIFVLKMDRQIILFHAQ